jgi:hypothetical protein
MFKVLSIVLTLFISTNVVASEKAPSRLNQIRNSLWVFGVDNKISEHPEIVEQAMLGLSDEEDQSSNEQTIEVPEELQMAILKIES